MSETAEQQGGSADCDVHLQAEIEVLKQALVDKQTQLIAMETACLRESDRQVELEDSIIAWQDKYERLYESHKRVQKVNQTLEDKLLKLVDRNSGERAQLTSDVATLSVRLAQANYNIAKLQHEIERYKTDINLAIQLLQCKPDSFVPQKVSSLPVEIQSKVSTYMRLETNSHSDSEGSTSGVGLATSGSYKVLPASDSPPPLCPFPPTAMVYSMRGLDARNNSDCNGNADQMISPSAMAKYLQDELKASEVKHCDTCNCSPKDLTVLVDEPKNYTIATQTLVQSESGNSLCLRCNSNLNSPSRTNSPYIMKIVKSSDSVISETKSSVSDLLDNEKLFTPAKKDDLMVNPILGHHRLCDRTISKQQQQQICDTAKYIVETRKLENEIADLRKFNNKSPNLTLGAELCNTFSRNIQAESELITVTNIGVTAQNGSAVLLTDSTDENEADTSKHSLQSSQQPSEKGTNSTPINESTDNNSESKPEVKTEPDSISTHGSSDKNIGNMKNVITGSTNSIWSKTSSSGGAKMFENFNRNLIKTIKAENPTHRGPRLCALRIQNGSNNILLDNMDSEVTPIVYTRPTRFLDEELDDSKDVITSKISMLLTKHDPNSPATSSEMNSCNGGQPSAEHQQLVTTKMSNESDTQTKISNTVDLLETSIKNSGPSTDQYCDAVHSAQDQLQQCQRSHNMMDVTLGSNLILDAEIENDRKTPLLVLDHSRNPIMHSSNCVEQQQQWNGFLINIHQNQANKSNYDLLLLGGDHSLNSSFKNTTTKSGTQSSSISSCGLDVDVQESAQLRRQQLTRVAEWVQNNSTLQHHPELKIISSKQYFNNISFSAVNYSNYSILPETSLAHVSNNSTEPFSTPTSKSNYNNGMQSSLNNNLYHFQSNSQEQLVNSFNDNAAEGGSNTKLAYNSNNYAAFGKTQCQHIDNIPESVRMNCLASNNVDPCKANSSGQPNVDLAQMEYNVKQFLLKQNEWSIRNVNKSQNSSKQGAEDERVASISSVSTKNYISKSKNDQCTTVKNHSLPIRTETNL